MKVVAGLYARWRDVDTATAKLHAAGFSPDQIDFIAGNAQEAYAATPEDGTEVIVGGAGGAGIGSVSGAGIGWLLDAAGIVAEETEAFLLEAPVPSILDFVEPEIGAGTGVGLLAGAFLGIHAGWRYVERLAHTYRAGVGQGKVLLTVEAPDAKAARRAADIFRRTGAADVRTGLARR